MAPIRPLGLADITALAALQEAVLADLAERPWLRRRPAAQLRAHTIDPHRTFGVFDGGALVAATTFRRPATGPEATMWQVIPDITWVEGTATARGTMVHPDHRGRGHGAALAEALEAHALSVGVRHLLSLVHPDNAASAALRRRRGYELVALVATDRGPRDLYRLSL